MNAWLEKGGMFGMLPNYATLCGLAAYRRAVNGTNFFFENGKKLFICMEGQGHVFTFDLIFSWSTCHAKGSCIH